MTYVITTTGFGGAERQVLELASAMSSRGWSVGVVSMMPMHEQFLALEQDGVRLASLDMTKGMPNPRALARLGRILRRWRPQVVHGHMVHGIFMARIARLVAPVPRVVSTMHSQVQGPQWRYYAFRATDRLSDVTTAVSRAAVEEAVRRHAVHRDNILLVPNGLRTQSYEPDPALRAATRSSLGLTNEFMWLTVGRLTPVKRHMDLLAAARTLQAVRPDTRMFIAGKGDLHDALRQEVDETGLGTCVSLLGLRQDVRALMQAADGFVMSSAWEGLPMALLEASASSLPVVATDVGGSRDVIAEGRTGFLSPPGKPARLADAMLSVMSLSPIERDDMGRQARDRIVDGFEMERVADRWEELYLGG